MGAAFAIQVMTGKEGNVQKLMEWAFSRNENAQKWIKSIHNLTESTVRRLSDGSLGKEIKRAVMPGYIFVEMNYSVDGNNQSAYIPADVWHLIKSIPGVLKQFTNSGQIIGADEFQKMLGLESEELQVEIAVPLQEDSAESVQVIEVEGNMEIALHRVNTASTQEERVEAEKTLEVAEQQMKELVEKPYEEAAGVVAAKLSEIKNSADSSSVIGKIKTILRNGKEIVRLPKTLLEKIILGTDSQSKQSSHTIIDQLFEYISRQLGTS